MLDTGSFNIGTICIIILFSGGSQGAPLSILIINTYQLHLPVLSQYRRLYDGPRKPMMNPVMRQASNRAATMAPTLR